MSAKNLYRSGILNNHELLDLGMMLESASAEPKPIVTEPKPTPEPKPELMTESAKDQLFVEAVNTKVDQDDRGAAAANIIDWSNSATPTATSFDIMAAALAGIDTDSDADITDDQVDQYNYWLGLLADAAVAMGADQDDVTAMVDDDDDDAASVVADAINVPADNHAEAIAQHQFNTEDSALMESAVKVVRLGKVVLIKKRPHPRRITAAQRNALKKNARKAHTAAAELQRLKSMRKRKKAGL